MPATAGKEELKSKAIAVQRSHQQAWIIAKSHRK